MLFRSPCRPQHVIASKVSGSDHLGSTDVCRCDFDTSMSTPGSIDSIGTFRVVSVWLRGVCVSQVSCFVLLRFADLYSLDLEPSASPSTPDVSVRTPFALDEWP